MSHASSDHTREGPVLYRRQPNAPSPLESRRVIPSGEVSPDGKRKWPKSSLTSKIIVFGGMGIAAAAATAGAVLAVRTVVDSIAGDEEDDALEAARKRASARRHRMPAKRRPSSGRYGPSSGFGPSASSRASLDDDEDEAPQRSRVPAQRRRSGGAPQRRQFQAASVVESVNETVDSLTSGVRDVLGTVTAAIEGFRSVATQAGGIMKQFQGAADQVKSLLDPAPGGAGMPRNSYARPKREDVVDLRGDGAGRDDERSHRL